MKMLIFRIKKEKRKRKQNQLRSLVSQTMTKDLTAKAKTTLERISTEHKTSPGG